MTEHTELDELRAEVAELRGALAELTPHTADALVRHSPPHTMAPISRRRWLRTAAGAAVAGTAVALSGERVAAVDNDPLIVGEVNSATIPTTLNFTGAENIGFLVQSGTIFDATTSAVDAALAGWTTRAAHPVGMFGYSEVETSTAAGVEGHGASAQSVGVRGVARRAAGTAIEALGGLGTGGRGVVADGDVAVRADGSSIGVYGSGGELGALLSGQRAGLRLDSRNPPPATRSDGHTAGEIDASAILEGADVWVCVTDGKPGVWRKIAGPGTAGSLHPIEPVRAYDSRSPQPSLGALDGGDQRVVSVKDGRHLVTGAVTVADAVALGATAIAYNVTVTGTSGPGFLAIAPGDASAFSASAINWSGDGVTVANAGIVKLDANRQVKVFAGGAGSADFIIDVTGFYL